MTAAALERYRRQLEAIRDRVRSDAEAVTEQTRRPSGGQGTGEITNVPQHLGDMGTDEYLHDLNTVLLENEQYLVAEAREALRRLDDGAFGKCERCGKSIAAERLAVMPYVRYCVACAAVADQAGVDVNLDAGRPRRPDDTIAPEGAMQEDWRESDDAPFSDIAPRRDVAVDRHAVGEPGGGSAMGGLAGTNEGRGDPAISRLRDAAGASDFDVDEGRGPDQKPRSGRAGGAVGGTPANKRTRGK
jgi:RNA polymerase-binding transcription factor DksA